MTRPNPCPRNDWEALQIEVAVGSILGAILDDRLPIRGICSDCGALIDADHPCPICTEIRRRQYQRLHRKTA
jgi:recombinational DNA repair protein RecR